jgi:peptidoglycan pentaglycine glycine transferase (the first glycine)
MTNVRQVGGDKTRTLNPEEWDDFVISKGGHLLQSWGWGEFKKRFGWEVERFAVYDEPGEIVQGVVQILLRDLPLGRMAYIPKGPVADPEHEETWIHLARLSREFSRDRGAIFLKVEPDREDDPTVREPLQREGFRPAKQTVQPRSTILVSLEGDLEEVLMGMKPKTRYNIRLAERKGVTVREAREEDIPLFYRLLEETGERDEFGIHEEEYYLEAWRIFAPQNRVNLLLAYYGEELLGGLMVFALGSRAWYLYGASSDKQRNRMPNHLLQWRAMCWAKERGCSTYDLWGIPEEAGSGEEDMEAVLKRGGLWGVYRFKRGFGGRIVRYPSYDYVYSRFFYWLGMSASSWLARLQGR